MPRTPELVPAAVTFRNQLNAAHPDRNKASDGWIGNAAHAARASFHNPDANNWVHAIDITHDPAHGVDIGRLTDELVRNPDPRILELIANRWYWNYRNPKWVPYIVPKGGDAHFHHMHMSIRPGLATAIDGRVWRGIPTLRS